MSRPFIVLGDRTSHGGTVVGASDSTDTHGKRIARIGDMVSCPRKGCRGLFPIAQGDASMLIDGAPAAYQGCKTACGATLIASQSVSTTRPGSATAALGAQEAPAAAAAALVVRGAAAISDTLAARYQDELLEEAAGRFRGRFQVLDLATGEPVAGQAMRVRSTGGPSLTGSTDAEGCTPWVERAAHEALAFDLVEQDPA
jgi:uncharacterized Zn-binding protein involved in type VI secretion